ncbi:hypothetical protein [Streptomyces anulatus]|uniref:hypothetical protein n=1 Tax=Streptomyces anulatus TaxID=1892 RepID=UPI001C27BB12|nr:hypothetical protein [Streptomyces anulatus]
MSDNHDEPAQAAEKATVQPAAPWPVYNVDRAQAELIAMDLLAKGVAQFRVRHMTKLSAYNVRRLAAILAEEANNPPTPRIVCRTPQRTPKPLRSPNGVRIQPARWSPPTPQPLPEPEPEQMVFPLD